MNIPTLEVTQEDVDKSLKLVHKTVDALKFKDLMEKFEIHIDSLAEEAKKIRVGGPETERKSVELGTVAKRLNGQIDKARMSAKRPYLDINQSLDAMVRPLQKTLTGIENGERKKCVGYRNELLRKEREAEIKATIEPPKTFGGLSLGGPKPVKQAEGKVETINSGSSSYKKVLVPKLADITKVPAKYLLVDWKAVKAAQKAGITKIDGIDFVEEMDMTMRS